MTESLALAHPFLVAGAVFLSLCVAIALAGALWVRRRWRRASLLWRQGPEAALVLVGRSAWRWAVDRPLPDRRWRAVARSRRQLRLSVTAAERAVEVAAVAGAPVGELRSLSRRLRTSADALDASLAIDQWRTTRIRRYAGNRPSGRRAPAGRGQHPRVGGSDAHEQFGRRPARTAGGRRARVGGRIGRSPEPLTWTGHRDRRPLVGTVRRHSDDHLAALVGRAR